MFFTVSWRQQGNKEDAMTGGVGSQCPVSLESVDANVARLTAGVVVVGVGLATVAAWPWVVWLLAADFGARALVSARASPVAWSLSRLARLAGWTRRPTDGAPKRFAAALGFLFTLAAGTASALGLTTTSTVLLLALGVCAFLEAALGLCVGCVIHGWLPRRREPDDDTALPRAGLLTRRA
jgi:hypothetical protein